MSHIQNFMHIWQQFDHGNSLFNLAGEENWKSEKVLQNYVETLFPCVYDDFISEAKTVMNDEIKEKLRKLLTFDIKKTGKNNYSSKKLKIMNEIIKTRVSILLQNQAMHLHGLKYTYDGAGCW